jgi:hypothetical protein
MSTGLKVLLCSLAAGGSLAILVAALRSRRLLRNLLLSAVSGVAALYAVNALGLLTGIALPVNALSLSVGAVGGATGVVALLLTDTFLRLH